MVRISPFRKAKAARDDSLTAFEPAASYGWVILIMHERLPLNSDHKIDRQINSYYAMPLGSVVCFWICWLYRLPLFLVDDTHPIEAGRLPNGEPDSPVNVR